MDYKRDKMVRLSSVCFSFNLKVDAFSFICVALTTSTLNSKVFMGPFKYPFVDTALNWQATQVIAPGYLETFFAGRKIFVVIQIGLKALSVGMCPD